MRTILSKKKFINIDSAYLEIDSFFKFIVFKNNNGYAAKFSSKYGKDNDIVIILKRAKNMEEAKKEFEKGMEFGG